MDIDSLVIEDYVGWDIATLLTSIINNYSTLNTELTPEDLAMYPVKKSTNQHLH